jgi:hypothetical protein
MLIGWMAALVLSLPSSSISSPKLESEFITEADLPKGWVKRHSSYQGASYLTYLGVLVSAAGQPVHCVVATTFGLPKRFDPCALVSSRAKFRPATDEAGEAIYGTTYVWFFWENKKWLGSKYDYLLPSDLVLSANRLPRPAPFGINVQFDILSDGNGHVEACKPQPGADANTLGPLACAEIQRDAVVPAKNADNMPVRAVQSYVARFLLSDSPTRRSR